MSAARKRRRQLQWDRYVDFCCRFGPEIAATRGMHRAYNRRAVAVARKNYRRARLVDLEYYDA